MKISELTGILDLAWQQYGDIDVWFYSASRAYYGGGEPGLSDTGGGWSDETNMSRMYSAFVGTDDYNLNDVRLFISTSYKNIAEKRTEHEMQKHKIHMLPLENEDE